MSLFRARCSFRPSVLRPNSSLAAAAVASSPSKPARPALKQRHPAVEAPSKLLTVHRESTVAEWTRRGWGIEFPCLMSGSETPRGFADAIPGRLPPACAGARSRMQRRQIGYRGERGAAEIALARYRDRPRNFRSLSSFGCP